MIYCQIFQVNTKIGLVHSIHPILCLFRKFCDHSQWNLSLFDLLQRLKSDTFCLQEVHIILSCLY